MIWLIAIDNSCPDLDFAATSRAWSCPAGCMLAIAIGILPTGWHTVIFKIYPADQGGIFLLKSQARESCFEIAFIAQLQPQPPPAKPLPPLEAPLLK